EVAGGAKASVAATHRERLDVSVIALEGGAQRAVLQRHAVGGKLEAETLARKRAVDHRLLQRAGDPQLGAQPAVDARFLDQRARGRAQPSEHSLPPPPVRGTISALPVVRPLAKRASTDAAVRPRSITPSGPARPRSPLARRARTMPSS